LLVPPYFFDEALVHVLFYVSGHGYGHATRTSEVLRALVVERPDWTIHVRSNVPPHLLAGIDRVQFHPSSESLDPGVVEETDSLGVDVAATLEQVERHYACRDQRVASEARWVADHDISLIVADFPPLAGQVAAASGIPCVGLGNFTWNWIYEPFFGDGAPRHLLSWIRDSYAPMVCWLRLPFSHSDEGESIRRVVDMPLVARRPRRDQADVLRQLDIDPADGRPRVVLAMRGRIPPAARAAVADANPDWLFLHFDPHNAGSRGNERSVTLTDGLLFTDVLNACDAAVSKFGYGMVSECIVARKRLLCPPRRSFREDEIFEREVPRQLRLARISRDDFLAGRWSEPLGRLLDEPVVEPTLALNGAEACAREIARRGVKSEE
jgi:L-arabinokinase